MVNIEDVKSLLEISSNCTSLFIFTLVVSWAIIKYVKMNEKVKNAIIKEKTKNV